MAQYKYDWSQDTIGQPPADTTVLDEWGGVTATVEEVDGKRALRVTLPPDDAGTYLRLDAPGVSVADIEMLVKLRLRLQDPLGQVNPWLSADVRQRSSGSYPYHAYYSAALAPQEESAFMLDSATEELGAVVVSVDDIKPIWLRIRAEGSTISVAYGQGDSPPDTWDIQVSDSDYGSGAAAVYISIWDHTATAYVDIEYIGIGTDGDPAPMPGEEEPTPVELSGTSSMVAGAEGAATVAKAVSGTSGLDLASSGRITLPVPVSGISPLEAMSHGALSRAVPLFGEAGLVIDGAGVLSIDAPVEPKQFRFDFTDEQVGQPPDVNWTYTDTFATLAITPEHTLKITHSDLSFIDAKLTPKAEDLQAVDTVEVLIKFRFGIAPSTVGVVQATIILEEDGFWHASTGFSGEPGGDGRLYGQTLWDWVDVPISTPDADTWYWRHDVMTTDSVKTKIWKDGDPVPAEWDLEMDSGIETPGPLDLWFQIMGGVQDYLGAYFEIDYIGIGINGAPAPTPLNPVEISGTSSMVITSWADIRSLKSLSGTSPLTLVADGQVLTVLPLTGASGMIQGNALTVEHIEQGSEDWNQGTLYNVEVGPDGGLRLKVEVRWPTIQTCHSGGGGRQRAFHA